MQRTFSLNLSAAALVVLCAGPAAVQAVEPTDVMAERGNGTVRLIDVEARLLQVEEDDRGALIASPQRMQQILGNLLIRSQLAADAREAGFDQDPLVAARMFKSAESTLANLWLEHYLDSQPDADYEAMAREYYLVNQEQFKSQPTVDVTHLLVSRKERSLEEARALAEELHERIVADPAIFDELVLEYSEDPSASANLGQFTNVKRGDMVAPFETAAFALEEPGDISQPVLSVFGYHIIRLDQRHPPEPLSFDQVKKDLVGRQRHEHRERLRSIYLSDLTQQEVKIDDEVMQDLLQRYVAPVAGAMDEIETRRKELRESR